MHNDIHALILSHGHSCRRQRGGNIGASKPVEHAHASPVWPVAVDRCAVHFPFPAAAMSHSSADADADAGAPPSSPSQSRSMAMARSLFAQLDADGDGWLRRGDLAAFIEDAEKLDEIAAIMDPHNTGRIDVHAFERCFDMFGADEDEEAEAEAAAEAAAAAAVPPPQVKAPAPRRHVSFGEADAPARVSVSGTARAGGGGISIPPAGAKKTALKAQNSQTTHRSAHVGTKRPEQRGCMFAAEVAC